MSGREPFRGDARDRLSRIGGLFLSDERTHRHRIVLHAHREDAQALPAIDLARAFARLGHPVTVIESPRDARLHLRVLPCADSFTVAGLTREPDDAFLRPNNDASARESDEIFIVESTSAAPAETIATGLIAVPADEQGMRRAWRLLKSLAAGRAGQDAIATIGATITGAIDPGDAGDCHARFAAAAARFLEIEVVSYACLLRDGQNREQELRNIAALLIADYGIGAGAAATKYR